MKIERINEESKVEKMREREKEKITYLSYMKE
jgi:hypothetical protein